MWLIRRTIGLFVSGRLLIGVLVLLRAPFLTTRGLTTWLVLFRWGLIALLLPLALLLIAGLLLVRLALPLLPLVALLLIS